MICKILLCEPCVSSQVPRCVSTKHTKSQLLSPNISSVVLLFLPKSQKTLHWMMVCSASNRMKSWDGDSVVAVELRQSEDIFSFHSTRWREGFPSFQFQVKSSRSLTVIRLWEDIESHAESRKVTTCWSEGQESQSPTALKFIFWISMLAKGFATDSGPMLLLFGFSEERAWTSAKWWNILTQWSWGIS